MSSSPVGLILASAALVQVAFVLLSVAATRAVGGRIAKVGIGMIKLLQFRLSGIEVHVGLLPFLSWVLPLGRATPVAPGTEGAWRDLPLRARLAALLAPWSVILMASVAGLAAVGKLVPFVEACVRWMTGGTAGLATAVFDSTVGTMGAVGMALALINLASSIAPVRLELNPPAAVAEG